MFGTFYLFLTLLSIGTALLEEILTPDVETRLRNMYNAMNRSVEPCDDFYEYMCGNWLTENPIPPDGKSWSELAVLQDRTRKRVREMLEEKDQPNDIEQLKLAKQYYRSCMDEEALEQMGLQPIMQILQRNGGWPIIMEDWTPPSSNDTWQTIHATYQRLYEVGAFYNILMNADFDNSSRIDIVVNVDIKYPLFKNVMSEDTADFQLAYTNIIKDIIIEFVKDSGKTVTEKQLEEIAELTLFQSLLQMTKQMYPNGSNKMNYERMTVKQLQDYYNHEEPINPVSHINFLEQFKIIFEEVREKITEDTVVEVHNKHELLSIKYFLSTAEPRLAVNYVHWNFVANFLPFTNRKMRGFLHSLRASLFKNITETPRWEICLKQMQLKLALSYSFAKKYSNDALIGKTTEMALKIREEMEKRIAQSQNLNEEGKEFARRKLHGLLLVIGYPEWYSNDSLINHYYDGLTLGPNYFQNRLNYHLFNRKKYIPMLGESYDKFSWFRSSTIVNGFYYSQANIIILPLAKFLDTLLGAVPDFMAYGRIGFVLGHEMSHAITEEIDEQYDENGYKHHTPLNTNTDEGLRNVDCIVKKFSKYILREGKGTKKTVYLDGKLTKQENMADAIAVIATRDALLSVKGDISQPVTEVPQELKSYTEEQLFFMALASRWCGGMRPELQTLTMNLGVHTPAKYRVRGLFSNLEEFSRAFNCPANSPMTSSDKCYIL